jgi:hypothetical protein
MGLSILKYIINQYYSSLAIISYSFQNVQKEFWNFIFLSESQKTHEILALYLALMVYQTNVLNPPYPGFELSIFWVAVDWLR